MTSISSSPASLLRSKHVVRFGNSEFAPVALSAPGRHQDSLNLSRSEEQAQLRKKANNQLLGSVIAAFMGFSNAAFVVANSIRQSTGQAVHPITIPGFTVGAVGSIVASFGFAVRAVQNYSKARRIAN